MPFQSGDCSAISLAFSRIATDRREEIEIKLDAADELRAFAGPVLERLLDEIDERHHHAAQVPQLEHDIGAR